MDLLIGDVFRNTARAVPARVAATHGSRQLTFSEIDRAANRVARMVRKLSVSRGDLVLLWSATSLDAVPLFAALAKLGAVLVPMNPALGAGEAAAIASTARPSLVVADTERIEDAQEIAAELGASTIPLSELDDPSFEDADVIDEDLREEDPHVVFFTSGSTGRPKGVVLSHRVNVLRSHAGPMLEPRGAMVCPYPLFHMAAWTIALQQWQARDGIVFTSADAGEICLAIECYHATRLNAIPAVWRRIIDYIATPDGRTRDLSSLRFADTGTSATPLSLLESIESALPEAHIRVFYGSTEAGSVASLEHTDIRRKPGSVGTPAPSAEVRVDHAGELWVRSPLLFDGYFDDPDATADALVDGWYRTGDLAEIDDDGYLTIVGRTGDVIRTGGESVAPGEVEGVLATHPGVADVAVIGVADERWGETVCAVVVPADPRSPPTVEDLRAHCAVRLAPFKYPRLIAVVDAIPRTAATGQIQRKFLAEFVPPI